MGNNREKDRARNRAKYGVDRVRELPENKIYFGIISRCENKNTYAYKNYGARGIKICKRWRESFDAFYEDMGPRPDKGYSIDRIDNDGDYCPENCRWVTRSQQARNRRSNHLEIAFGKEMCLADWADEVGLTFNILKDRLRRGWCITRALLTPKTSNGISEKLTQKIMKYKNSDLTQGQVGEK